MEEETELQAQINEKKKRLTTFDEELNHRVIKQSSLNVEGVSHSHSPVDMHATISEGFLGAMATKQKLMSGTKHSDPVFQTMKVRTIKNPKDIYYFGEEGENIPESDPDSFSKQMVNIFSILGIPVDPEASVIDMLKTIERKFEQMLEENRQLKKELPDFYSHAAREYNFAHKKNPKALAEYIKSLKRLERAKNKEAQIMLAIKLKPFRHPVKKYIIRGKSKDVRVSDQNQSQIEDEKYFS